MPALTQPEIKEWVDDYLEAMSAPQDWPKLKALVSKRIAVTLSRATHQSLAVSW